MIRMNTNDICETFKLNVFSHDDMKLKLFSQTLTSKALTWYKSLPADATPTWKDLANAFLRYYFPNIKINEATTAITDFKNRLGESLVKGYLRFRRLLDHCPHHDLPPWLVLHTFYGGLNKENISELDASSNGAFMHYIVTQAWELLDIIRVNKETWKLDLRIDGGRNRI